MVDSNLNKETLDLSWGNPLFLLELLDRMYKSHKLSIPIKELAYSPDIGEVDLLKQVKNITEKTTGNYYKYYLITNGATQAINTIMRVWGRYNKIENVVTAPLGYPYYDQMIYKNNLRRVAVDLNKYTCDSHEMVLIDSPSNPLGNQYSVTPDKWLRSDGGYTIFDGVYHNLIYNACPAIQPPHDVYVGSFSKLLGLTGARVGWLATNNQRYFDGFASDSLYENATVSKVSQRLVTNILENVNLDEFMRLGKNSLDQNRQILQKLSPLLGTDVPDKGMFYCAQVDQKMLELFDRANVKYITLALENKILVRLNIGQTSDILNKAVQSVLKADRRKL